MTYEICIPIYNISSNSRVSTNVHGLRTCTAISPKTTFDVDSFHSHRGSPTVSEHQLHESSKMPTYKAMLADECKIVRHSPQQKHWSTSSELMGCLPRLFHDFRGMRCEMLTKKTKTACTQLLFLHSRMQVFPLAFLQVVCFLGMRMLNNQKPLQSQTKPFKQKRQKFVRVFWGEKTTETTS